MSDKLKKETISIIYNQDNDSPKYFELKKSKLLLFVIGLPTITLIGIIIGIVGLIHTSPFHLIDNYRQNSMAREAVAMSDALKNTIRKSEEEKQALQKSLLESEEKLKLAIPLSSNNPAGKPNATSANVTSSAGISSLSFFKFIANQHDITKPAILNLTGFKIVNNRDTTNLQFNIIPNSGDEKIAGHIVVIMKNELTIEVYPAQALNSNDPQINYSSGEPFATQRFRPVDASFLKPRKAGNYIFSVFIFAKNGDLMHVQNVILPVKI